MRDAAELAVDGPSVRAADRADVDDRLVARVPAAERLAPAASFGTACRGGSAGARASCTVTEGVNTCTLDEAPTVIASGAVPGEPMLP